MKSLKFQFLIVYTWLHYTATGSQRIKRPLEYVAATLASLILIIQCMIA